MKFCRIDDLPPYVFATVDQLKRELRRETRRKVVLVSYPHNPTTAVATREDMQRLVDLAREQEFVLVHDFAYADIAFDGHEPPSILAADGAHECAVELYSLTKSFSMAGWRVGFVLGRADVVGALAKLKSYLDYGTFQPIQIASTVTLREAQDYPAEVCAIYKSRRDTLIAGLGRAGWDVEPPRGTMFVWAPIPDRFRGLGSLEFALRLARDANVAVSPGIGFGDGGDGHVRFADERRGDVQQLAHPRAAGRPLVADHDDVARRDLPCLDRGEAVLLGVEHARRAAVVQALVSGELHDAAVGREVASQDREAA